jgi:D-alanyl-D-alanine carboxypeptidase
MGRGDASLERVRSFVEGHRALLDTPGLAIALTDRDRTLGVVLDGLANVDAGTPVAPEHRFQIGSISKGFTVMALLQQRAEGRLDLDAPVTEYLPWFEVRSAFGPIAVHHLLSHTAGIICGMDSTGEAAHEVWALRHTHAGWAPGERFLYSNVGYKALGLVLEAVTGRPWWQVVRERVMEPIGMGAADVVITNASRERLAVGYTSPFDDRPWQPRHGWAPSPWFESATADGTICATAAELAAYARLVLNRGRGVLSEESFEVMTCPVAEDPGAPGQVFGYGLKWLSEEGGPRLLGHSGGMVGFTAYLLVDPETGFGATVLMNSAFGDRLPLARFALASLAAEARDAPLPDVPEPPDRSRVADAPTFAGAFGDELGPVRIRREGDRLFLDEGDGRIAPLLPVADGRFVVDDPSRDRYPLDVVRRDGAASEAFWGPRWLRAPDAAVAPDAPAEWLALTGRYRSWDPWAPGFEVLVRGEGLRLELLGASVDLEGTQPLVAQPDGSFVVGEPPSPSRIRFDTRIDGRPTRAVFDAAPFYRTAGP